MPMTYQTNPRIRAFGKARLDIAGRINNQWDWDRLWKEPANPFPFNFDSGWKQCIEYRVDDFAAEIGFLIDLLGWQVHAISPDYAMFTSPGGDFYISVASAELSGTSTPPEAIRIQFMLADLSATVSELEQRGVDFEQKPQPSASGSPLYLAIFRTPHGIPIDLWGEVSSGKPDEGWFDAARPAAVHSEDFQVYADPGEAWPEAGSPVKEPYTEDIPDHNSSAEERSQDIPAFIKEHLGSKGAAGGGPSNTGSSQAMPSFEKEPEDQTPDRDTYAFGLFNPEARDEVIYSVENRPEGNTRTDDFNAADKPEPDFSPEQMPEAKIPEAVPPEAVLPEASPGTEPDEEEDLLDDPFAYLDQPEEDDYIEEPTYEDIEEEPPDEDLSF